jgi:hypothetical protein
MKFRAAIANARELRRADSRDPFWQDREPLPLRGFVGIGDGGVAIRMADKNLHRNKSARPSEVVFAISSAITQNKFGKMSGAPPSILFPSSFTAVTMYNYK